MTESSSPRSDRYVKSGLLLPVISIVVLFVFWRLEMPWVALPLAGALMLFYLFMPGIVRRRLEHFNKEAMNLLARGQAVEVIELARRDIILQLFAPTSSIDGKQGLAHAMLDDYASALVCFESALRTAGESERMSLLIGYVKALFVTGDLSRAVSEGRRIIEGGTRLPELLVIVARARIGLGHADDWTRAYLNNAEELSPSKEVALTIALTRIEWELAMGESRMEIPENADSKRQFVRAWIHLVRAKLRLARGNIEEARHSLAQVFKEDHHEGFVSAEARGIRSRLERATAGQGSGNTQVDPVLHRKKKKRR